MDHEIIIKPKRGLAAVDFKELWHYRELFYFLSLRDIKLRYKQTVFGIGWAILQPFIMMVVFSIVFGKIAKLPSDNIPYPIFSYAGLLFWNVFSNSLGNASQSLIGSANMIQKVYLPKIILPVSSMITALVDFFFSFLVFLGILAYYRFMPNIWGFVLVPFFLLLTVLASMGLGLFLAAINVRYRDVRYALPFVLQILIFITPVIYPVSIIPAKYQWVLFLNPMTGIITAFKSIFLSGLPVNLNNFMISMVSVLVLCLLGIWYFFKTEKMFADII